MLEEIVVTAQKREELIQDVPIAITAMSGAELEARGITSFTGVAAATPSVTVEPNFGNRDTLVVFMRGLGNISPTAANSEGAVGFYEDGFFLASATAMTFDLADTERVEVLRGPQGTLYGMNTTGGAVNLISKKPTGEFGIKQTVDFGNRNLFRSLTAINLPKWGDLSAKVTLLSSSIGGYVKNAGPSHDFGEERQRAGRLQLRWQPTENFTADYFGEVGRLDWTPNYYQNPSLDGTVLQGIPGFPGDVTYVGPNRPLRTSYRPIDLPLSRDHIQMHGLTLTWEVSDALTLKSLTGYRDLSQDQYIDYADILSFPFFLVGGNASRQFSQEFQFVGTLLDGGLDYVAGLYYFDQDSSTTQQLDFSFFGVEDYRPSYQSKSKAAYGQVTWKPEALERRLELTVGARYTKDDRSGQNYDVGGFIGPTLLDQRVSTDFNSFNPALIVNYKWNEDLRTYVKMTTGYRAGGVAFTSPGFPSSFKPEKVTTYEAGLKSDWLDGRLRLNADVFYSKYKDLQQLLPTGLVFFTAAYNVGRATIQGLELEMLATPFDDLTVGLSYSYLDPKFDSVPVIANTVYDQGLNPASPYSPGDNIASLFTLPFASKNSVALAADYVLWRAGDTRVEAHADYRWQSKYYSALTLGPAVGNRELGAVRSYGILNGRLTLASQLPRGQQVSVSLWGRNLTDNRHLQGVTPTSDGAIPGSIASTNITFSEPRAYGVSLGFEF